MTNSKEEDERENKEGDHEKQDDDNLFEEPFTERTTRAFRSINAQLRVFEQLVVVPKTNKVFEVIDDITSLSRAISSKIDRLISDSLEVSWF